MKGSVRIVCKNTVNPESHKKLLYNNYYLTIATFLTKSNLRSIVLRFDFHNLCVIPSRDELVANDRVIYNVKLNGERRIRYSVNEITITIKLTNKSLRDNDFVTTQNAKP